MLETAIEVGKPQPLGVSEATGRVLPEIADKDLAYLTSKGELEASAEKAARARAQDQLSHFGLSGEAGDANNLGQAGWGVIFPPDLDQKVKEAMEPLLAHRRAAANNLYKEFSGSSGFWRNDTAERWLARRGLSFGAVDPLRGVPYYLLIVGSPEDIPFEFQYSLDTFWAVGRLHFETPDEYRSYANSVLEYETASSVTQSRNVAMFATEHDFDSATQSFVRNVAQPMADPAQPRGPIGSAQRFDLLSFVGKKATKETLRDILRGTLPLGSPALLFTGTHGLEMAPDDELQSEKQGALVCQDWQGFGEIRPEHYFAASDLPSDAHIHGLIHFFFACYGAGYPRLDDFSRGGVNQRILSNQASISRLPQKMLAHESGALACLGHVERAWSYSFLNKKGDSQASNFRDVIARILKGDRVGNATDQFNLRWTVLSAELLTCLEEKEHGATVTLNDLSNRWVARNDARNYIILGDPAVQLRVSDMSGVPV
jgi:hypothetical protein